MAQTPTGAALALALTPLAQSPQKDVYLSFVGPISEENVQTLIARCNGEIQNGATRIHLLLSSYGGGVAPGVTAYTLLKGLPVELVTHNTGNVGSIANVIFLAGKIRYASAPATFWFHGTTSSRQNANAAALQSAIDGIKIDDDRTVTVLMKETSMTESQARALLTSIGTTITADEAKSLGIIHDVRDVAIPSGASFLQFILAHPQQ